MYQSKIQFNSVFFITFEVFSGLKKEFDRFKVNDFKVKNVS